MRKRQSANAEGQSHKDTMTNQLAEAQASLKLLAGGLETTATLATDLMKIRQVSVFIDSLKKQLADLN